MHTVVFVANRGYALASSRKNLIQRFIAHGWRVVIVTTDDAYARELVGLGAVLEPVAVHRGGLSILRDLGLLCALIRVYRQWKPLLVNHFHAKPVILGSLAARLVRGHRVRIVNVITGLGSAFVNNRVTAVLAGMGYRLALAPSDRVVFQNRDDMALFRTKGWVGSGSAVCIASSGVDVSRFRPEPEGARIGDSVLMLGRLIRPKGTRAFVELAAEVTRRYPDIRFVWAGEEDQAHPDAEDPRWFAEQEGVDYLGRVSDVRPLFQEALLVVFPSFYREGVPRAVLEAAAVGLPVVAYDVPGVREAIRDGETGYLVPVHDGVALRTRVLELVEDAELRCAFGANARAMVEAEFDIQSIEAKYFGLYRELGFDL